MQVRVKSLHFNFGVALPTRGHLSDAAVVNGLLTATSLLSLANGELNAVSLSLPAGQALMTALSARNESG